MKKPYDFKVLSNRTCKIEGCNKKIKKNIIDRNPDADLCYRHFMEFERMHPRFIKKRTPAKI
jgi:hypothetical protein